MPLTIRCPDCARSWVLDETGKGGEFICPSCLARISLDGAVPVEATAGVEASATATPVVAATATASPEVTTQAAPAPTPPASTAPAPTAPAPAATAAEPAARPDDEIICPRCQLHFYPRGKQAAPSVAKRHTVLVVEDQEYFRQIAADALESGFDVKTAGGAVEAREVLAQGGIDLLVLDLTLGDGDEGEQLLRELTPKPCPILIFTAQDESELYGERWEELSQFGADDLLMKGIQVGESLRRKVCQLLGEPTGADEQSDAPGQFFK